MEPTSPGHISSHDAIIPWSKLQAEAIVHVNDVMEGRVAQRRTVHELPPRPPERGCGRWLRDSYPVATPKTNEEKAKEEKGSLKKTIQPNTLICQRLAKAASVQRLASIAASQLIPPVPTRQLDQQEYEARVALDTLSVLIGARKVEFEPNGGRRNSFRTRVREQDPSFDIQEARGIFLDITKILMPYLVKGKYSLSHLTVMFQCVNSLRLDPDDFSRSALSQAADLISHASNQLSTSINSGAYCTFLQSISHSSSKRIYHMSSAETKKKIESSSDWFCQRMSARQVAVAYSCFVKLDAVSWESSLVALLTSKLRSSDWTREPDSLVQIWASFGSQLRGSAGQHPQSISTNFAKILLSHLESTSNGGSLSLHQMLTSLANSVTIFRRLGIHPSTEFISAVMKASKEKASDLTISSTADLLWSMASLQWLPTSGWLLSILNNMTLKRSMELEVHCTIEDMAKLAWALSELSRLSPRIKSSSSATNASPRHRSNIHSGKVFKSKFAFIPRTALIKVKSVRGAFRRPGVLSTWMRAFWQDCSSLMSLKLSTPRSDGQIEPSAFSWAPVLARTSAKLSCALSILPSSAFKRQLSSSLSLWAEDTSATHASTDIFSAIYGAVYLKIHEPSLLSSLTSKSLTLLSSNHPNSFIDFLCLASISPRWKMNYQGSTSRWFQLFFSKVPPAALGQRSICLAAIARGLPQGDVIPSDWLDGYWRSTEASLLGLDKAQMVQMSTGIVMLYQRSLLTTRPSGEWIQSFTDRFSMLQGDGYLRLWERTIICQGINTIKAITRTSREGSYGEILD